MTGYSDFQFISWWKNSSLVSFIFIFKAYLCSPSLIVDAIRQLTDISIVTFPNYFSSGTNYRYIAIYWYIWHFVPHVYDEILFFFWLIKVSKFTSIKFHQIPPSLYPPPTVSFYNYFFEWN